jgi:hypothetical protein
MKFLLPTRTLATLACAALAACGSLEVPGEQYWLKTDNSLRIPSAAESLAAYHAYVWALSPAEWKRENTLLREAVSRDKRVFQQVRQAIVASAPVAPPREHQRALALLERCERDTRNDNSLRTLVAVLLAEVTERLRLETQVRDEAKRAEDLEQKLNALRNIDLKLMERGRPAGSPKP